MIRFSPWLRYSAVALVTLICGSAQAAAQEGRPALPAETAEDARVKQAIHDAMPRDFDRWSIDSESDVDGIRQFHDSGEAVRYPFTHQYAITYVYQPTDAEAAKWRAMATDTAGIQQVTDETRCEITVFVNGFERTVHSTGPITTRTTAPFSVALHGLHGAQLFLGPWKAGTPVRDSDGITYQVTATRDQKASGTAIQTMLIAIRGSSRVVDLFVGRIKIAALASMIGEDRATRVTRTAAAVEAPLAKPVPGSNVIEFTLDGGDYHGRVFRMKHSATMEFAYLRNNHPDAAVTDNAVTRVLASEDDDFTTKNKTAFLDVTVPFIRRTGSFEVTGDSPNATFQGGVNCWDGCEWTFDAVKMTVTVTKYDPVNGFVEGDFSGEVTVKFRPNLPTSNRVEKGRISNGHFKVRRQADRY